MRRHHIARLRGLQVADRLAAQGALQLLHDLQGLHRAAAADVDGEIVGVRAAEPDESVHHVIDKGEVPHAAPAVEELDRLAVQDPVGEGHDRQIRPLPRSVDGEEAGDAQRAGR